MLGAGLGAPSTQGRQGWAPAPTSVNKGWEVREPMCWASSVGTALRAVGTCLMEDFGWHGTASQGALAEGPKSHSKVLCRQREGGSWTLQVWLQTGLWGTRVPRPPGPGRPVVRPLNRPGGKDPQAPWDLSDLSCGSVFWPQLNVPVPVDSSFLQTVRESGGGSRAGRMMRVFVTQWSSTDCLYLPSGLDVMPCLCYPPIGAMKGSGRHAVSSPCQGPAVHNW